MTSPSDPAALRSEEKAVYRQLLDACRAAVAHHDLAYHYSPGTCTCPHPWLKSARAAIAAATDMADGGSDA